MLDINRPSWDKIWMQMAETIAQRSHHPTFKVGAIIVTSDNTQVLKFADPKRAGQYVLVNHMPTEYATTNDNEDFAETFAMFILDNDNLSQHHKNRIINTLTKSRVQGKTVMNAHKDLKLFKDYIRLILA